MIRDRHAIDLTRVHFRREQRGYTVHGTWLRRPDPGTPPEPCLVVTPAAQRLTHERVAPCVVPLSTAWAWAENGSPKHAARTSAAFLHAMGVTPTIPACMSVTMLIRDHLGDLIAIPPMPVETEIVADAIRTDGSGRTRHAEIRERV